MSDLLAKCDWDEDELHVYIAEWPEVVYVWVDEKTMPYAPVVADVRSLQAENAKLQAEMAELQGTIECLKGLADATSAENAQLRERVAELEELTDDKRYIPQEWYQLATTENARLRKMVLDLYECVSHANEQDWFHFERDKFGCGMSCTVNGEGCGLSVFADRLRELGIEVEQ